VRRGAQAPVAWPRVTLDTLRRPRYRPLMAEGESGARTRPELFRLTARARAAG